MSQAPAFTLPWLQPGEAFPSPTEALGPDAPYPGLLAAGGALDVPTLLAAYGQGIFPWFSAGEPILWWSTAPRMTLQTADFKLRKSLKKAVQHALALPHSGVRVDTAFERVIAHCAHTPRDGQGGTWIVPEMVAAYTALHHAGHAHSVETWIDGELVGGLYVVNIGRMVFGESMFAHRTDASKIALTALVALCRGQGAPLIDCQQNTAHLASLGAAEMPREDFLQRVQDLTAQEPLHWHTDAIAWPTVLKAQTP